MALSYFILADHAILDFPIGKPILAILSDRKVSIF